MKTAIIGTGKISEEHLVALAQIDCATVSAVCDLSPALARYAADRFGIPVACTDHRQLLTESKPDVVHVLTPPHTHMAITTDCLEAGAHVIIEKPVAPTNAEFQELWALAEKHNRRLIEDHNYRFNEPVLALEELVAQGRLGQVREVEVAMTLGIRAPGGRYADANLPHPSHQMPAGVIHEFITHLCYLALRFVPAEALAGAEVAAQWHNHGGGGLFKHDDLDALVVAGQAHLRIRFTCSAKPDQFALTVRGSEGYAHCDLFQPHLHVVVPRTGGRQLSPLVNQLANGAGLAVASLRNFVNKIRQKTPYEGLHRFLRQTYAALANDLEPPVTYDDVNSASRLVDMLVACQGNGTRRS